MPEHKGINSFFPMGEGFFRMHSARYGDKKLAYQERWRVVTVEEVEGVVGEVRMGFESWEEEGRGVSAVLGAAVV